jgi:hypothetical protein
MHERLLSNGHSSSYHAEPTRAASESEFFGNIPQFEVGAGGEQYRLPTFFEEVLHFQISYPAPLATLRRLLPSGVEPLPIAPGRGALTIGTFAYRQSDLGPYNEVSFTIPAFVRLGSLVFGAAATWSRGPTAYVWRLPVTTERSRYYGVEVFGLPKFLADIAVFEEGRWTGCRLSQGGELILESSLRHGRCRPAGRFVAQLLSRRGESIVRSSVAVHQGPRWLAVLPPRASIALGPHELGRQLETLGLGRPLLSAYFPKLRFIMSSPTESYPGRHRCGENGTR